MNFSTIMLSSLSWLPAWFVALVVTFLAVLLALFVFKLVAFVLDCLPFI